MLDKNYTIFQYDYSLIRLFLKMAYLCNKHITLSINAKSHISISNIFSGIASLLVGVRLLTPSLYPSMQNHIYQYVTLFGALPYCKVDFGHILLYQMVSVVANRHKNNGGIYKCSTDCSTMAATAVAAAV